MIFCPGVFALCLYKTAGTNSASRSQIRRCRHYGRFDPRARGTGAATSLGARDQPPMVREQCVCVCMRGVRPSACIMIIAALQRLYPAGWTVLSRRTCTF